VEALRSQKKDLYLAEARFAAAQLRRDLAAAAAAGGLEARLGRDRYSVPAGGALLIYVTFYNII
jgi:hypothetical protein